jgi:hypothetical protein
MTHTLYDHEKASIYSDKTEGYEDGWACRYEKGRSVHYRKAWKRGRAHYLTGMDENASSVQLPVIEPDGKYHIQTGYKSGAYKDRYVTESQNQAVRWYDCINTGNGYKKRLVGPDGALEYRHIS